MKTRKELQKYILGKDYYNKRKEEFQKRDDNMANFGLSGLVTGFLCVAVYPPLGMGMMAITASYTLYKHSKYIDEIENLNRNIRELEKNIMNHS